MIQRIIEKVAPWIAIPQVIIWAWTGNAFIRRLMEPHLSMPSLTGLTRVQAILLIGLASAAAYGILWTVAEWIFGKHHEGQEGKLPQGWSAAVLSATVTVPLVLLPMLYGLLFGIQVVQPGHLLASFCVIIAAAIGHLAIYGIKSIGFPGIKCVVFPLGSTVLWRALVMELIYAVVHFGSIVFTYRFVLNVCFGQPTESLAMPTLISASLWLLGVTAFIFLKFPDSLADEKGIETRRVVHGLMLMLTLQGGMLM